MIENPPQPPQRGNGGTHPSSEGSSTIYGVEYLVQAPSAMFSLEVLQTCPMQRKALLLAIGRIDH